MKILIKGKTVRFNCTSCGCIFKVGFRVVRSPDNGENFYEECPMCGGQCHADTNSIDYGDLEIKKTKENENEKIH